MATGAENRMQDREVLEGMLHDVAERLSPMHVAVLVAYPHVVRSALAAAADALAASDREWRLEVATLAGGASSVIEASEASRRLALRTREGARDARETLLSSDELAARTGLKTRQSVHDWRRKGRIVGWQNAKRGYVFPTRQLDENDRPLPGLDGVARLFGDGYAAWVWLTTPLPSLDGAQPLALLAAGEAELVADAARGDLQGDFA